MSSSSRMTFWGRVGIYVFLLVCLLFILVLLYCNYIVKKRSEPFIFDNIDQIPKMKVALVLGTSRYTSEGNKNRHYYERLKAVASLYKQKKIRYIIVSGDNSTRYYNEPALMKKDLGNLGIPDKVIYRDYAGFRTLDSVIRANKVFGQHQFIIVSQRYQNFRAVYIARAYGIKAVGFDAKGQFPWFDLKNRFRVWLARLLAFVQVILHTQPHFLGVLVFPGVSHAT